MTDRQRYPKFAQTDCPRCGSRQTVINGAWLRWRRESAGLSLRDMGARLGFSAVYLSDVELNRRHCTPKIREAYEAL